MKTYLAKRNHKSDSEAIKIISKYGVAKVLEINRDSILEEFVDFKVVPLGPKNLGSLLRKIHSEKDSSGISLVHGDFGEHNTTRINGEPKCFDYEYAHFGNTYSDIGKVVLRNCDGWESFADFFIYYNKKLPDPEEFKEGLIYFCDWQSSLRLEKDVPYSEVPLVRKNRLLRIKDKNLCRILEAFKSGVNLK